MRAFQVVQQSVAAIVVRALTKPDLSYLAAMTKLRTSIMRKPGGFRLCRDTGSWRG
jgi:hypothetical protein